MFDLVNFDIGGHNGRGMPYNAHGELVNPTARKVASPRNSARSKEVKAAQALAKAMNTLDPFNAATFAYFFSENGPEVNVRMFKCFEALLMVWADKVNSGMADSREEEAIGIEAQRIIDAYNSLFRQEG